MDEIKLVDLRKDTLNTVKEAIKMASSMGAAGFKLFVNPNLVKNGLISTRIVPISIDSPPKSQLLLNFAGLKNLKTTLEFAKKVLGEVGEIEVQEKEIVLPPATVVEEAVASLPTEESNEEEIVDIAEDLEAEASSSEDAKPTKKTKRKKKTEVLSEEEGE